jgi:hypothetical protein
MLLESVSLALVLCSPAAGALLLLLLRGSGVRSERVLARVATTALGTGFLCSCWAPAARGC